MSIPETKHMPRKTATPGQSSTAAPSHDVDALMAALDHPFKAEVERLRTVIRGVDPRIAESVKWNAPSFSTSEHFATFHLRARNGIQVVLHLGAKPRLGASIREEIADPAALLEWRAADRATVTFRDEADVTAKMAAFAELVRQWIAFV